MKINKHFKIAAKKIPFVFWMVGFYRYLKFRADLSSEDIMYRSNQDKTLPPPMLRYRVHKELDQASYNLQGSYLASVIEGHIKDLFTNTLDLKILDFACGPGRVIVKLKDRLKSCQFYGSDVDAEAITWAKDHLRDIAKFSVNQENPPSQYKDGEFDIVYTISLFTHLNELHQDVWLNELLRVVKKGGYLIASVHGKFARTSCSPGELEVLSKDGFLYRTDYKGKFKLDGLPDFYQTTFHTKGYILEKWSELFHVENYVEGGLSEHQDIVILRKP